MNISKDGLVIWSVKTGEADKVLTILTEDGLITAYARGSLKPTGRLTSASSILSFSNFELASGKNMYTVVSAESIKKFLHIYSDAVSFALVTYFCEVLKYTVPTDDEAKIYYKLMLNSLYLLNEGNKPLWQIKGVFELTVMTLFGYMPNIMGCSKCGVYQTDTVVWNNSDGSWLCSDCSSSISSEQKIPYSVISAIRYVVSSDLQKAFAFDLKSPSKEIFCSICEKYLVDHIDHDIQTLDYYNSIKGMG